MTGLKTFVVLIEGIDAHQVLKKLDKEVNDHCSTSNDRVVSASDTLYRIGTTSMIGRCVVLELYSKLSE